MSLIFNEKAHKYRLDGRPIPGVTTLIGGGLPKPALTYWSAQTVAEYVADHDAEIEQLRGMGRGPMVAALKEVPWQKRDKAAIRGTDVHDLAERLVAGEEVDVPEHLTGHVESCVRFLDEWQPTPLVVERPLAHRAHWWAGKPDLIARMPNGEVWLWDYKTADSGVFPETALQLAAYSHAEFYVDEDGNEQPLPHIDRCAAVHLRADGYSVIPVKADDDAYKTFRHIAFVANAAKRMKDEAWVGQPIDPPTITETSAA